MLTSNPRPTPKNLMVTKTGELSDRFGGDLRVRVRDPEIPVCSQRLHATYTHTLLLWILFTLWSSAPSRMPGCTPTPQLKLWRSGSFGWQFRLWHFGDPPDLATRRLARNEKGPRSASFFFFSVSQSARWDSLFWEHQRRPFVPWTRCRIVAEIFLARPWRSDSDAALIHPSALAQRLSL